MIIVTISEDVVEIIGEEKCVRISNTYVCGIDYMLVKGFTFSKIMDDAFGFVGREIPIVDIKCSKYLMYYGYPKIMADAKIEVEGWRRIESDSTVFLYNCIEDAFEFFEIEEFIFRRVPLSSYGVGSTKMYDRLMGLSRTESLYMLRYFY